MLKVRAYCPARLSDAALNAIRLSGLKRRRSSRSTKLTSGLIGPDMRLAPSVHSRQLVKSSSPGAHADQRLISSLIELRRSLNFRPHPSSTSMPMPGSGVKFFMFIGRMHQVHAGQNKFNRQLYNSSSIMLEKSRKLR